MTLVDLRPHIEEHSLLLVMSDLLKTQIGSYHTL